MRPTGPEQNGSAAAEAAIGKVVSALTIAVGLVPVLGGLCAI
jgi:hypothetical protein